MEKPERTPKQKELEHLFRVAVTEAKGMLSNFPENVRNTEALRRMNGAFHNKVEPSIEAGVDDVALLAKSFIIAGADKPTAEKIVRLMLEP